MANPQPNVIAGQIASAQRFQAQDLAVVPELINTWDQQTHVTGFDVLKFRVKQICNSIVYNIFDPTVIHEIAIHVWTDLTSPAQQEIHTNLASRVNEQKFGIPTRDPGNVNAPPASDPPLPSIPPSEYSDVLLYGAGIGARPHV